MILQYGFYLGLCTFLFVLILDLFCIEIIKNCIVKKLYLKAFFHNIINLLLLGPISYFYTLKYFCDLEKNFQIINTIFILYGQSILYYFIHKLMHTSLVYRIHSFHHKFNEYVIPMTANAVSIYEFIFAYIFPIVFPIILIKPDFVSINISIAIISFTNILIHTPFLRKISTFLPNIFVSTDKHMLHHKIKNKYFSAPTINFD